MENSDSGKKKNPKGGGSFKRTNDKQSMQQLISQKLLNIELRIEIPALGDKTAEILSAAVDEIIVKFEGFVPPTGPLLLSGFINNYYTEVGAKIEKPVSSYTFLCKPTYLRIASAKRMDERFAIREGHGIIINHIRIAKPELDFKGGKIPVSYKILFQKEEHQNSELGDRVIIKSINEVKEGTIYSEVMKTGNSVFVPDSNDPASLEEYENNQDLINLKDYWKTKFQIQFGQLSQTDKIGWIVCPIVKPEGEKNWIPIGYIEVISKTPIEIFKFMEVKAVTLSLVEKLRDMNMLDINHKQQILDVSRSGLALMIKDKPLMDMIKKSRYFIFSVVLKLQAPITFRGWVRFIKQIDDQTWHVGVKIQGETERQDHMKRYLQFINTLSTD